MSDNTIIFNDEPGSQKVKLYNPFEKNVSTDDLILSDFVEDDGWKCELVDPKHPALKKRANVNPFKVNADWAEREAEMITLMKDNIGMGLSCPQIGQSYRMFVMIHSHLKEIGVYNPVILETEGEVNMEEGCLTWPLLYFSVKRPERIKVRFTKTCGTKDVEMWMDGIDARCFLHELDHLNGVVYLDYAGDLKLKRAKQKRDKYMKKMARKFK